MLCWTRFIFFKCALLLTVAVGQRKVIRCRLHAARIKDLVWMPNSKTRIRSLSKCKAQLFRFLLEFPANANSWAVTLFTLLSFSKHRSWCRLCAALKTCRKRPMVRPLSVRVSLSVVTRMDSESPSKLRDYCSFAIIRGNFSFICPPFFATNRRLPIQVCDVSFLSPERSALWSVRWHQILCLYKR